jgi:hypothetical protein
MSNTYCIRVSGHLDDRWSDWFDGLVIQRRDDGTTVLIGPIADQAALHGVLARIRDLGLPLLSVNRVAAPAEAPSREGEGGGASRTQRDPAGNGD